MGQSQTQLKQNQDYRLMEQLPVGNIVKHNKTQSLHFLKQYSFTAQQAYQNALNMHSLRLANKNQHILNFLHFTTKSQNSFCSSFHKIILIFEYSDHSLEKDISTRLRQRQPFSQKQIWSILCSCVLAAVHLIHCQGKMHCGLTSKDIRLTSSGNIKLLSHQMIGIDTNHTQSEGVPKTLAITLIECINLQKVTNQDDRYLQQLIQKLDSTRDMKQILMLMLSKNITFVELQQHLFKLVQDDQSLASNSNTPVLKSQSPIQSSTKYEENRYKCPKINRNSSQARFLTHTENEHKGKTEQLSLDYEDTKSYLHNLEQTLQEEQNPDQTQQTQDEQKQPQLSEQRPKQINSFYLKERKLDSMNNTQKLQESSRSHEKQPKINHNISINKQFKDLDNIKITKSYEINVLQSSRRKESQVNKNQPMFITNSIKSNYQLNSIQSQDNLFTDPKLFSLIKSDLEDIKMRRSIGQLGKFTKTQQFVTTFNNIEKQPEYYQQNHKIQNGPSYQINQVKSLETLNQSNIQTQITSKIQQQSIKSKLTQPQITTSAINQQNWLLQQKPNIPSSQTTNSYKIQHNFTNNKNIQMIKQVSQEYREEQQQKKTKITNKVILPERNEKKQQTNYIKNQKQTTSNRNQLQRIENIMSDNQLGFRKKKQSTAKFQLSKQNTLVEPATTTNSAVQQNSTTTTVSNSNITSNAVHVSTHVSNPISHTFTNNNTNNNLREQNNNKEKDWFENQNKGKTKGTFRQVSSQAQLTGHNSSNEHRYQQYFHDYSRSQSNSRLSSNNNRPENKSKQSQEQILVKVNENYTRGRYEGTKLNNKRHGYGTFYYSQGGKYVGYWKQNKMHGKGILYYPNQKVAYDGDWQNDQLSGYGVLFNEQVATLRNPFDYRDWTDVEDFWVKYQGHFYQDNKEGQGKLYIVNGQRLEAQFHDDKVDGEGILYRGDGSCVKGKWRQNKLIRMF